MKVGYTTIFQGVEGMRDLDVWQEELRLCDLVEPLGFDSLWSVEHHFTSYTMCPDVLQFLTFMAGRTERVQLGSMAVILPWHDPVRVAEQVTMLDNMSGGRFIFGMGRGLGRIEFEGLGIPMSESRERFVEAAEIILSGLEQGYVEYDGKYYQQERRDLRPTPVRSFKDRVYAAAVSPESVGIMAKIGAGILINPQKEWSQVAEDLAAYRAEFRELRGMEPPAPVVAGWVCCHEDEDTAREMAERYIGAYYHSVLEHYEIGGSHFEGTKGYEYYAKGARSFERVGVDAVTKAFLDLQIWGTPAQCYEKILAVRSHAGNDGFNAVCSFSGMPYDVAEANIRLFAREVMPALQALEPLQPVDATSTTG